MMSVKLKRLTALLLSACLAAGNITTAFGAPVQPDPEPGARVRTSRLISTEETVWRYLDDNTDPAAADDTKEETPGSPSNASPSDASPSNASAKYGFYRFAAGKNKASSKTGRLVWTSADYDDSGWKEARGSFGAKKGEIADLGDGLIPYTLLAQYIEGSDVAEDTDIPAYFFRTTIELEDIDSISALNGEIFYDDAAIIYINGEEVHRAGVPEGGYTQNLEYGGTNAGTPINNKFQITDLSMLKEGSNTVSVELHQGRANSSDIYFDFCSLEIGTPAAESDEFITTEGTVWNYLENNTDPAEGSEDRTIWTYPEFADEQWKSGKGSFGAKKGAIADLGGGYIPDTLLKHYIDGTSTAVPTYFFRTDIYLNDVSDLEALEAEIAYDDAVIVYINGKNVYEGQVPEDGYDKNLAYGSANGLSAPSHDIITINDVSMLRDGVNTIAVELHQDRAGSSDIYFDFISLKAAQPKPFKAISLGVWNDETQTAVTWYSSIGEDGKVRIAEKADMDGDSFPEQASEFAAERAEANDAGFYSFQAVMTGLEPDTAYVYQVGAGETWSDIYEFTTRDYENGFNFLLAGDPQIGAGSTDTDTEGWQNTLKTAMKAFPETSFLISAGDQVNTASNEAQYAGYLSPKELLSLPAAVNVGNHDAGSSAYSQHFQVPNVSSMGMTEKTGKFGGDYWYTYNNVLFMSLNSNNMSTAEHREFMKAVLDENGADADWTVVTFHHSIYSTASHESDNDIIQRRAELSPVFTELGIDVVLMGHDHVYTRSYMMNGTDPIIPEDGTVPESVTDPAEGEVLYVTANSASGSKYYSIHNKDFPYAAVMNQESTPNITNVEVTDKSFAITTYRTKDMSVVDTFAIYKDGYQPPESVIKSVSLGVGADESETMVTWYSDSKLPGKVQLVKKSDLADGVFPETAAEFAAEKESANEEGFFTNQAVIRGLESATEYAYRVGDGTAWSDVYDLTVQDYENGFNFLLAGDPQIGAGSTDTDIKGWQNTMETAMKAFPETSFLISAGDQVNTASNETQYAGYLSPKELLSLPAAVNVGNHDAGSSAYSQHFQVPNVSSLGMTEKTGKFGGDYWYTYNNVLFMSLNSNNMSTAEHRAFMKQVLDENGADADWTVVTFHHSIYSTASHESDNDIIQRRAELSPVFTELGIDVVLMGHDHVYTRSYMMNGNDPVVPADGTVPESVTDPAEGEVLYVTANSASGSKYYSIHNKDFPYAAVMNQESTPNITNVEVTDNSFAITTYRTTDMSEVDHFTIYRTEAPKPQPDVTGDTVAEILESLDQALEQAETEGEKQEILKKAAEAAEALSYDPNTMDESEMDKIKKLEDMVLAGYSELAAETDVQSKKVTGVTVEGAALSVPLKAGVKAAAVLKVSDMELPEALGFETEDVIALDIRLDIISDDPEVSGGNIQPKVPVRITIDAPEDIDLNRLVLMHYTNGAYEDVKFTVKDGAISFVVNALSPFVLAEKAEADKPDDGGDGSDDGSSDNGPSDNGPSDSGSSDNGSSDNGSSGNGSSSSVQGSWIKDQTGWWYQYQNKTYPVNTWVSIQGIWYHFDQAGYMQTGWIQVNGVWYYLQPSGAMVASDWVLYQDKWYYFNQDGAMATAPVHYKGTEYRFDESGACINP